MSKTPTVSIDSKDALETVCEKWSKIKETTYPRCSICKFAKDRTKDGYFEVISCRRFPRPELKDGNDWCGEFKRKEKPYFTILDELEAYQDDRR